TFAKQMSPFFPEEALDYVYFYFNQHNFNLKISSPRLTKKGDFKFYPLLNRCPSISINNDLCSYEFLLVYIHELAHYYVFKKYSKTVKAHGKEWKEEYKKLLINAIEQINFPDNIAVAFRNHLAKIKSSSSLDEELMQVFDSYKSTTIEEIMVKNLQIGDVFLFRNKTYQLDSFARTRACCTLLKTQQKFLVNGIVKVKKV
ncbi:MAG: hypothetical protein RR356_07820, partial [Bacteroidales bacterium]